MGDPYPWPLIPILGLTDVRAALDTAAAKGISSIGDYAEQGCHMRSRALLCSIFGIILMAVPLLAGGLDKFKNWDQSPQGYLMTKAEKTQWAAIKTDEEAEKFVSAFVASRKPEFVDEVANRATQADKYLTVAKVQGSKSLRGKVIILLGPPSAMDVAVTSREDSKRDNPLVANAMTNTGGYGVSGRSGDTGGGGNTLSTTQGLRIYHFSYQGAAAKALDRNSIEINVEVDADTGKDRIASRSDAKDVEEIFEIAAQSWLKK
jgi:GWxTD domain-containing protein